MSHVLLSYHSYILFKSACDHLDLHSFPTRRSSDLTRVRRSARGSGFPWPQVWQVGSSVRCREGADRKSTRLNSSHRCISYAVFCLKKKNKLICNDNEY